MMKFNLFLFIAACFAINAHGQYVDVSNKSLSTGTFTGLTVMLKNVDQKSVISEWSSFMKDYSGKTKYDKKNNESVTTGASIGGIGGNVSTYATHTSIGNDIQQTVWFADSDVFLTEADSGSLKIATEVMEKFILHMKRYVIQSDLNAQDAQMKNLQKDLDKEMKNEEKSLANIEKLKQKITEEESNIVQYKQLQDKKKAEIEAQLQVIEGVKQKLNSVTLESDL